MTDNEIIKALECCHRRECQECVRLLTGRPIEDDCRLDLIYDALDLINRQRAEIERLQNKVEELSEVLSDTIRIRYVEAKAEAIKEFAEAVKMEFYREFDEIIPSIMADKIDSLVKEMTEGEIRGD